MKRIFYCLLLLPISLSAQINESDTLDIQASLSMSGFWQGGNVQTLIYRANSDLSIKPGTSWVFKSKNSYVYQEFGKVKADEDILSLNFLYYNPHKRIHPFVLGFVSTNFRRAIGIRSLFGVGGTVKVLTNKRNWLVFSVSGEYEQTDFSKTNFNRSEFDGRKSIDTFRGTIWVNGKYHLIKDKLIFSHESYVQPSLEHGNNYRWRADLRLDMPLWDFMDFNINYIHTYESIVIAGQKRGDQFLTFGFTLKSY